MSLTQGRRISLKDKLVAQERAIQEELQAELNAVGKAKQRASKISK